MKMILRLLPLLLPCFGWTTTTNYIARRSPFRRQRSISLPATVYIPDGDGYCELDDEEDDYYGFDPFAEDDNDELNNPPLASYLAEEELAALARMAVAFSDGLKMKSLEHVEVLNLYEDHIDIQAVVCEEDGCVTVAVPVQFPDPCANANDEYCILENLDHLDAEATIKISELEWYETHFEEVDAAARLLESLKNPSDWAVPHWWVRPSELPSAASSADFVVELQQECDSVRKLLNEEGFAAEIRALALQTIVHADMQNFVEEDMPDRIVEQAAVAAVGPAGLVIRASASTVSIFEEEAPPSVVLEIPIPFSNVAACVEDLRAAVLGAVAAAAEYAEHDETIEEQPQVEATTVEGPGPHTWVWPVELPDATPLLIDELHQECDSVLKSLNEEGSAANSIRALALQTIVLADEQNFAEEDMPHRVVEDAHVAAVGPAGLVIRALASTFIFEEAASPSFELELPVPFSNVAGSTEDLQAAVMGALSGAAEFAEH